MGLFTVRSVTATKAPVQTVQVSEAVRINASPSRFSVKLASCFANIAPIAPGGDYFRVPAEEQNPEEEEEEVHADMYMHMERFDFQYT